ncbi:MAG: bifunctional diguanylate cyclase/phosphodiesterase, partial [Acidimicrobiales bacterium]
MGEDPRRRGAPSSAVIAILDQVTEALEESSGSHTETLALVARATGARLEASCLIWLLDGSGHYLDAAAFYDPDPGRKHLVELAGSGARHLCSTELFARVLASAVPTTTSGFRWQDIPGWADPDAAAGLALSGEAVLTLVTLRARDHAVGVLGLMRSPALDSLSDLDHSLLRHLGERLAAALDDREVAVAIEDERRGRHREEIAERAAEANLALVARGGPVLLLSCDRDGLLTVVEGGLVPRLGHGLDSGLGRRLTELFPDDGAVADLTRRGLSGESPTGVQLTIDGVSLEASAAPIRGDDGSVEGFTVVAVDISARVAAERVMLAAARRQAALVDHASDAIVVLGAADTISYVNPAAERLLGYPWRAGDTLDLVGLVHPEDRDKARSAIATARSHPSIQTPVELRILHASGDNRIISVRYDDLTSDASVGGFVVFLHDVTDERSTEDRILATADRQAALADLGRWALAGLQFSGLLEDAISVLASQLSIDVVHVFEVLSDTDFLTLSANHGHDVGPGELLSADPTSSPASFAVVTQETVTCEDLALEQRFDVPDLWARAGIVSLLEVPIPGQENPFGVLGVGRRHKESFVDEDVNYVKAVAYVLAAAADRQRSELAIREQVLHDPLTGLPNRLLLADQNVRSEASAVARMPMSSVARTLFVFDIDRFKEINDTLGHGTGDVVLIEVARRLNSIGPPMEVVARLGGDEFAVIAQGVGGPESEDDLARHILSVIAEPLDVGGVSLRLRGSVGIASGDLDQKGEPLELSGLLRRAEAAMYQAKSDHDGVRRYSDDLERSSLSRLALASELADAIEQGQLTLDYQPKVLSEGGRLAGVEALVRWNHPTRGLLLPDVFIPLAEQTGLVREMTNWVLARGLAECASWHRGGWSLPVAVNLSAATVHDPALGDTVMAAVARSGLPASALELEITESAVMLDPEG